MNYPFSSKVSNLAPSAIREILKSTSQPGMIPFAAGNPAPEAFPIDAIREITADILQNRPVDALQYSITEGYEPLRTAVAAYMRQKHGVGREFDSILITAGAQQVMCFTTQTLCNEHDTILCEAPTFIGSLNAFRSFNVNLVGIDVEADGMNIEKLEQALKTEKNVRFIYTVPNFQNPSGVTMSAKKRRAVYELARKYNVMILEDNPYGEIRFEGEDIPCIKSLDEDGIVIYAGSFSKVLSPGLRVGYAIAPQPLIAKMTCCKQTSDVHTGILPQMIAHDFMTKYDFNAHLEKIRAIYRHKARLMMGLMDEHFDGKITYHPVSGGLFLWCTMPQGADMLDFCRTAVQNNVALVPGSAFSVDESAPSRCFRANYSTPTDEQIVSGMQTLGRLVKSL